jgi:hypothetical protein
VAGLCAALVWLLTLTRCLESPSLFRPQELELSLHTLAQFCIQGTSFNPLQNGALGCNSRQDLTGILG